LDFGKSKYSFFSKKRLDIFRLISILLLVPMMIVPVILNGYQYLYIYITQWSIEFATIATILMFISSKFPNNNILNRVSLLFLESALFLNLGAMITFWYIFPGYYFCCIEIYWIIALSWSHLVPQIILLMNLFLCDINIRLKGLFFGMVVGVVYLVINYIRVVKFGNETTYHFLDWNEQEAIYNSIGFIGISTISYIIVYYIKIKFFTEK
tara:strand:- start:508 stop:1137 length:630 start_codon:yes stop_codon:yes gene_type:complete